MPYTLNDFMQDPKSPSMKQFTNCQDFDAIILKSVSVQEYPFDDFIQENELVLSTAIGWEKETDYFLQLIEAAVKSHAAAILFAFVNQNVKIPERAITLANQFGLPLFEIPWSYRFSKIQSMVYKAITKEKQEYWQNLQNQLCNLFFESASLEQACQVIREKLQCSVAILDSFDRVIAQSDDDLEWLSKEKIQEEILIQNIVFGKFCMEKKENKTIQKNFDSLRKSVLFPLSLWFNQKSFEDSLKEKLKNEFVCNLAMNHFTSYEEMLQQAYYLHFDLSYLYGCVVLKTNLLKDSLPGQVMEIRNQIETILLRIGKANQLKIMLCYLNECFVVYIENKDQSTNQQYVESANAKLMDSFPNACFYWGMSESPSQKNVFNEMYQHASLALQYALTSKDQVKIFPYHSTRKTLIVSYLSESEKIQEAAQVVLGPLLDYDQSSSANLFETLVVYLNENYNISKSARKLHIHRQSLLYRLDKIEQLSKMKLNCHDDLFVLEVFTRIYRDY